MSTKKLARELGLLRQRSQSSSGTKRALVSNQTFAYLIVIDFESTCWREKNNYTQEVIEFPAVLLNTSSGEVESEFHTYVQPQEHPILSGFCTELTGITQVQVEEGIPLQICLSRFGRWLQNLQLEMGVVFPNNKQQRCSAPSASQKLCTFLTWSDWDLGVCLQYECKRKQLHKPDVLNSWIDLRSTYRLFYDRKPKGLNGALQDLGIQFSGREHSGLDDARNTAQLAARMMRDGCVMKITRSLERAPSIVRPVLGNKTSDGKKEKPNTNKEENALTTNKPSLSKIPLKSCQIKSSSEKSGVNLDAKERSGSVQDSAQIYQSLISPKTLLNGTTTPLWTHGRMSVTSAAVADTSSSVTVNHSTLHSNGNKSLVLCSTTLGYLSRLPRAKQLSKTRATVELVDEENSEELSLEMEERCGSYDDVVLEGDGECGTEYVSDFDSGCYLEEEPDNSHSIGLRVPLRDNTSAENNSKISGLSITSVLTKKRRTEQLNGIEQHSATSGPNTDFVVPKAVTWFSKTGLRTSLQFQEKSGGAPKSATTNTPSPLGHKPFIPAKTSTPNTSFAKPKPVMMHNRKNNETPWSSFTIYTDTAQQAGAPSRSSLYTPKSVLCSSSANTHSSCTSRSSISMTMNRGQRITSPLCGCGRRAKRQVVSNGGPNHGRGFYCCPVRRSGSGGRVQKGCEFFKWESSLMKSTSAVASPAAVGSVSLGHINSTLSCRPQQRPTLRKSY
ncbi:ERI1 exoribonuclease 2 [Scophthalmus maximus]|uniref:ERI1 exoribonuclease 2 n=1 Tax=Scophthalmus maximus TaxID=52904 RepID=UPI001FA87DFB|nr:ERI1 exoribonuclease 2 [Scophthalmus maximus]